jgi:hypothetical protein
LKIKKRILFYIFSFVIFVTALIAISVYFSSLSENILPKQVEFKINNPKIQAKIDAQIQPLIKIAIRDHKTKSELFDDISNVLSKYDIIDNYTLRLGFDGKLVVFANVQHPVLAVHVKNNDKFVVGSGMKIIEKNPHISVLQSIPNIFLPNAQIKDKNDKQIDFAWFLDQINLINENFQWYDLKVYKIIWTDDTGFTVNLKDPLPREPGPRDSNLIVYLGRSDINVKIERFKTMSMVLKQKNLKPREIDLDLIDRAFIK